MESEVKTIRYQFADFVAMRGDTLSLLRNGETIKLTFKESVALTRLLEKKAACGESVVARDRFIGRAPMTRDERRGLFANDHALTQGMSQLKKKLANAGSQEEYIKTHESRGYEIIHPVMEDNGGTAALRNKKTVVTETKQKARQYWKRLSIAAAMVLTIALLTYITLSAQYYGESIETVRSSRDNVQEVLQSYSSMVDRIASSLIIAKLAKTPEQKEGAAQQFKDAIANVGNLDVQRQAISRAIVQLESVDHLDDLSQARDELSTGLARTLDSMDDLENGLRAVVKQLAGVDIPRSESFAPLLTAATAKKKTAIKMVQSADAKFAITSNDWPTVGN